MYSGFYQKSEYCNLSDVCGGENIVRNLTSVSYCAGFFIFPKLKLCYKNYFLGLRFHEFHSLQSQGNATAAVLLFLVV